EIVGVAEATTWPIWFPAYSVHQALPSAATATPRGSLFAVGTVYSRNSPAVLTRPILFVPDSANQSVPSVPVLMAHGWLPVEGMLNEVTLPAVLTWATAPEL